MRDFLIQKHFYFLTNQTQEVRKLNHRVTQANLSSLLFSTVFNTGRIFQFNNGHSNSNIADAYLFVNEITFQFLFVLKLTFFEIKNLSQPTQTLQQFHQLQSPFGEIDKLLVCLSAIFPSKNKTIDLKLIYKYIYKPFFENVAI